MEEKEEIDTKDDKLFENIGPNVISSNSNDIQEEIKPQASEKSCACTSNEPAPNPDLRMVTRFVYAIGRVQTRFPRVDIKKEFIQSVGLIETAGLTDQQAMHKTLSDTRNHYLVRQMCWVFSVEGIETYIMKPSDSIDYDLFVEALRSNQSPADIDVIIGRRGPISSPEICNGLMVPIVEVDQIYSFDMDSLAKSVPRPEKIAAKEFNSTVTELLNRIMQMADNAGAMDEHRALNYLAVRYSAIYSVCIDLFGRDFSLTSIQVLPSRLSGIRKIVDVVFSFTNRNTDVMEKFYVRVDVTNEFPFLVSKIAPYYDR